MRSGDDRCAAESGNDGRSAADIIAL